MACPVRARTRSRHRDPPKLLDEAASAGARAVIAETTANNPAALAALRHNDARLTTHQDSAHVHAQLALDETQPPPSASPNP